MPTRRDSILAEVTVCACHSPLTTKICRSFNCLLRHSGYVRVSELGYAPPARLAQRTTTDQAPAWHAASAIEDDFRQRKMSSGMAGSALLSMSSFTNRCRSVPRHARAVTMITCSCSRHERLVFRGTQVTPSSTTLRISSLVSKGFSARSMRAHTIVEPLFHGATRVEICRNR
jgi:hypothetical protein